MSVHILSFISRGRHLLFMVCLFIFTGCAGPLFVKYVPKAIASEQKIKEPVTIAALKFKDARDLKASPYKDPRTLGRISVVVADISEDVLTISEDVDNLVTRAFLAELREAGYKTRYSETGDASDADFILSGEVRALKVDIASRNNLYIEVSATLIERETKRVIWTGTEAEKSDTFAGVMGNTRDIISYTIAKGLSKLVRKVLAEASPLMANTTAAYAPMKGDRTVAEGSGRLLIKTNPARARVYINEVYYGLTPLSVDIEPGVHPVVIKEKGFKALAEKASVRKGQMTEMDLQMEKE